MASGDHMIFIRGGAAGLNAAETTSLLGAKTALIEEHRLGGVSPEEKRARAQKSAQARWRKSDPVP
jgi:heterodisulfide reductase subunit A-like polyferredoxin